MTFVDTNTLEPKEPREGWKGTFFSSESMGFAFYTVEAGALVTAARAIVVDHPKRTSVGGVDVD